MILPQQLDVQRQVSGQVMGFRMAAAKELFFLFLASEREGDEWKGETEEVGEVAREAVACTDALLEALGFRLQVGSGKPSGDIVCGGGMW